MGVALELPWPPSLNSYYMVVAGRKKGRSQRGRIYRDDVHQILMDRKTTPMHGDLRLEVYFFPPDRKARDFDNHFKAMLDALQHDKYGLFLDDSQIKVPVPCWGHQVKHGAVILYCEEILDWQPWSYDDVKATYFGANNV